MPRTYTITPQHLLQGLGLVFNFRVPIDIIVFAWCRNIDNNPMQDLDRWEPGVLKGKQSVLWIARVESLNPKEREALHRAFPETKFHIPPCGYYAGDMSYFVAELATDLVAAGIIESKSKQCEVSDYSPSLLDNVSHSVSRRRLPIIDKPIDFGRNPSRDLPLSEDELN